MLKIGHAAYVGENELKVCATRAEAIRELQSRGVPRDVARAATTWVLAQDMGATTVYGGSHGSYVIEVASMVEAQNRLDNKHCNEIINRNAKLAMALYNNQKETGGSLTPHALASLILKVQMKHINNPLTGEKA